MKKATLKKKERKNFSRREGETHSSREKQKRRKKKKGGRKRGRVTLQGSSESERTTSGYSNPRNKENKKLRDTHGGGKGGKG